MLFTSLFTTVIFVSASFPANAAPLSGISKTGVSLGAGLVGSGIIDGIEHLFNGTLKRSLVSAAGEALVGTAAAAALSDPNILKDFKDVENAFRKRDDNGKPSLITGAGEGLVAAFADPGLLKDIEHLKRTDDSAILTLGKSVLGGLGSGVASGAANDVLSTPFAQNAITDVENAFRKREPVDLSEVVEGAVVTAETAVEALV